MHSNKNPSAAEMFKSSSSASSNFCVGCWALGVLLFCYFPQSRQPFINTPERLASLIHPFPREIKWHAVMHTQQRVTELASRVTFHQNIRHRVKITQRLRHFLSIDQQMR